MSGVTIPDFAALSNVMASETASSAEIENAKTAIRAVMEQVSVEEHMHIAVDVLATLRERDSVAYMEIIYAGMIYLAYSSNEPPF